MATKMKGIFKGFKNMFSTKEHEMEIGLPTNVKHLSHIGFDSSSNHAPTWMNKFQEAPDYTSASLANCGVVESSWLDGETQLDQSRSLNASTTSRDESKRSKRLRRKKKAKNPGSPSSSNSVSRNKSTNSKMKSSPSKFRASCAAAMEDTCVGHREPSANELFVT